MSFSGLLFTFVSVLKASFLLKPQRQEWHFHIAHQKLTEAALGAEIQHDLKQDQP